MRILLIIVAVLIGLGLESVLLVYSYGQFAERSLGPPSTALPVADDTELDRLSTDLEKGKSGETGLVMLTSGVDAFAARALASRAAGRSLDLMYYIWEEDLTGRLMAGEVLKAADRGVKVRMLLDDFTTNGTVAPYLALNDHPNIEVRMFNPTRARENALRRGFEMLLRLFSQNHRMHNKAWIADARVAIVGGRNIGDDYFDATPANNFSDLDVAIFGLEVAETENVFDEYWNSNVVLPITALARAHQTPRLDLFREAIAKTEESEAAKPYLDRVRERISLARSVTEPGVIHWSDNVEIHADPPQKALREDRDKWLILTIAKEINAAKESVEITAPYFVPTDYGTRILGDLADKGVSVAVLTNSLAATDAFPVGFSGYTPYRVPLLRHGVKLFEQRPETEPSHTALYGERILALHTKTFAVDDDTGFIGSFNFSPRSAELNTEMGVVFHDADLIAQIRQLFAQETTPDRAYSVTLNNEGRTRWRGDVDGQSEVFDHDPETSPFRRFFTWFLSLLPIEAFL